MMLLRSFENGCRVEGMCGEMLEIENAVFPENIVFSQKNIVFFVDMTFSSVFEAPGKGYLGSSQPS